MARRYLGADKTFADDITVVGLVNGGYLYQQTVVFTGGGTFSKATYPGIKAVRVRVQAGGGSGGGCAATAAGQGAESGGGGAGEYREGWFLEAALSASTTVTVGAGGAAATAGANTGNTGGTSSFGAHISCIGGSGGSGAAAGSSNATNPGGAGGTGGSGGYLAIPGGKGAPGRRIAANICHTGFGGSSAMSGVAPIPDANSTGQAGGLYGGGSSGANSGASVAARASVAGGAGIILVDVYV